MNLYFPPGRPDTRGFPLQRYLPPLPSGAAGKLLDGRSCRSYLDIFGSSPRMLIQAAAAGCRVLVCCANPVLRFLILHTAKPFRREMLQTALTRLGDLPKDNSRLEIFLKQLYRTHCEQCGRQVTAESFIWEAGKEVPSYKSIRCQDCSFEGEVQTDQEDAELVQELAAQSYHREMMLTRTAPPGDPGRAAAAEALNVYSPRALTALDVLLNKMSQLRLEPDLNEALRALVLSTLDRTTMLWSHPPESRPRPRQLSLSPRCVEYNIWNALLWSVDLWSLEDTGVGVCQWQPGEELLPGRIHVYPGPARSLLPALHELPAMGMLSVLPRPNQAFWTLSGLWSAWIPGFEEEQASRQSTGRQRYSWKWYADALQHALTGLPDVLEEGSILSLLLEAEPSFTGAVFAGFGAAGFRPGEAALHEEQARFIVSWADASSAVPLLQKQQCLSLENFLVDVLLDLGEPAGYFTMAAAAQQHLAASSSLAAARLQKASGIMERDSEMLEQVLEDRKIFIRMDPHLDPESGVYWLKDPAGASEPLGDRVERVVLEQLSERERVAEADLLERVYKSFAQVCIPGEQLVAACAASYAELEGNSWLLRPDEYPEKRRADCDTVREMLVHLGGRLGFEVEHGAAVRWWDGQRQLWAFHVSSSAALGPMLSTGESRRACVVCPGSRSGLVLERIRRDDRFSLAMERGARVVKFRHVRRLLEDPHLQRHNFETRLDADPLENEDPQIRLL